MASIFTVTRFFELPMRWARIARFYGGRKPSEAQIRRAEADQLRQWLIKSDTSIANLPHVVGYALNEKKPDEFSSRLKTMRYSTLVVYADKWEYVLNHLKFIQEVSRYVPDLQPQLQTFYKAFNGEEKYDMVVSTVGEYVPTYNDLQEAFKNFPVLKAVEREGTINMDVLLPFMTKDKALEHKLATAQADYDSVAPVLLHLFFPFPLYFGKKAERSFTCLEIKDGESMPLKHSTGYKWKRFWITLFSLLFVYLPLLTSFFLPDPDKYVITKPTAVTTQTTKETKKMTFNHNDYRCFPQLQWLAKYSKGERITLATKCKIWSKEMGLPVYQAEYDKGHSYNYYHISVIERLHKSLQNLKH